MIPALIDVTGAPWQVLPAGVHKTTLEELATTFATDQWRRKLFAGLLHASRDLSTAGCARLYVNGSYVTGKPIPGDYDVCWDPGGVDRRVLAPEFLDFSKDRATQKAKYGGEFFPSSFAADTVGNTFLEYFQIERYSGARKGILEIELINDPMIQAR
ncbi:MAG: hypothetical protein J4G15_07555 [Alphaproteobacteria bacterium]|nr:hypothetical protein [Alphaproteobacteria bacterium]